MKKIVLSLVLFMIFVFFFVPWFACTLPTENDTTLSGAELFLNISGLQALKFNCAPRETAIAQMAAYFIMILLACVGTLLTIRHDRGPLWFWIVALIISITGFILLLMSTMKVLTESIMRGAYLSFFANLALIITIIIGMIISLKSIPKGQTAK